MMMWVMSFCLWLCQVPVATATDDEGQTTTDTATDSVMVMLQERSELVRSCAADIRTVVTLGDQSVEVRGTGFFRLPNLMRIEKQVAEDAKEVVVSDGSYLWMHDVTENAVTRINLSRVYRSVDIEADLDQFDPLRPFRGVEWESIRHVGSDTVAAIQIFTATPLPNLLTAQLPTRVDRVELRVGTADGLLHSSTLLDGEGSPVIAQRFTEIRKEEIDPGRFRFVVPAGAHPMDATAEVIQLLGSSE